MIRIALCILLSPLAAAGTSMEDGLLERRQGRFEESILSFQRLLKAEPNNSRAWYELGLTYASDRQYAKAVDAYRLALAHGLDEGQCHCALALALRETQKPGMALASARRCLALIPGYAGAWILIGNAEIDLGHFGEALAAYDKAVVLKPGYANAHYNRALALEALNREEEASVAFKEALRLSDSMQDAWVGLGNCLLRLKRPSEAIKHFQQALRLSPQEVDSEWGLARCYRALGESVQAERHEAAYKRLLRRKDNHGYFAMNQKERRGAAREIEAWDRESRAKR